MHSSNTYLNVAAFT